MKLKEMILSMKFSISKLLKIKSTAVISES